MSDDGYIEMNSGHREVVRRIVLDEMVGMPKDTDPEGIEELRWKIHAQLFEDERLSDISAVDLTDESDYVLSENGWRVYR